MGLDLQLVLNQDLFMEQYFQPQRENIFKNVQVLIYVFDVTSKDFNESALCAQPAVR